MNTIGKIDRHIYQCITKDIMTDEVIMTDERIQHIKERHPNDYERFSSYFSQIIEEPDYIVESHKENTAVILKEIDEKFKIILKLVIKDDPAEYKNSIISFWRVGETTWQKIIKNKKILYKKE